MKSKLSTLAGLFLLLGVLGVSFAQSTAAQDNPDPFVVTVPINVDNFYYSPVTIPKGMRLVIDFISLSGAAQSSSGGIQPIILLNTQLNGSASSNLFYIAPQQSTTVNTQYYFNEKTVIYADALAAAPAYAGFTPSFMVFNLVITGHLIPLPQVKGPIVNPGTKPVTPPGITAPRLVVGPLMR